jgi:hypothetical protein
MKLSMQSKKILSALILCAVALCALGVYLFFMPAPAIVSGGQATLPTTMLTIGSNKLTVELATTQLQQNNGLSGRTGLLPNHGMFFVFDAPASWGIWMKDMKFPIDILWADQAGRVVTIAADALPSSYPQTFYPTSAASYVLELPAGYAAAHHIATGAQIVVQ